MRRSLLLPFLLTGGVALASGMAGCEAKVEAELDVSQIRERDTTGLFAFSRVSTGDCDRSVGASEREGSLGWTNWVLSGVFPDTRFHGCRETNEDAIAIFRNMIVFDASPEDVLKGRSHVNLKLRGETLSVGLPDYVQGNIRRVRDQVGIESGPAVSGQLILLNSSDEPFAYRVAIYEDSGPAGWSEARKLAGASRVQIELPAALGGYVLTGNRAPILKLEASD